MFQELSDILNNRVQPEVMSGLFSLTSALEEHQATRYKEHIVSLMMEANNHDPQTLVDRAQGIVYNQVKALLQQMTIKLDVDLLRPDQLAEILSALHFKPSDFDGEIKSIIEAGDDSLEIFMEILALLTNRDAVEYIEYVLDVPMDVIIVIKAVVEKNIENSERAKEGLGEILTVLNKHQNVVGNAVTLGMESFSNGMVYSDPVTFLNEHRERLLSSPLDKVADDLISVALHVQTPPEAVQDEVMHYVESLYDDLFTTQQIFKHVRSRLKQMTEQS